MNSKTAGSRGPRIAGALALVAAVVMLATGCGMVHVRFGASGGPAPAYRPDPAYAQCMRAHGLPDFPAPGPWGPITTISWLLSGESPVVRANAACEHLLPG